MNISIKRFNPTVDNEPYYTDYDVPWFDHISALEALVYVCENYEQIAHDYSCRGRTCGRCSLILDGTPCTPCTTALEDTDHVFEPLSGYRVVRDLIVDKSQALNKLSEILKRQRVEILQFEDIEAPIEPGVFEKIDPLNRCARCLACTSGCPVFNASPDSYAGPAAMIAIALRDLDPYDEGDRVAQAVQEGLWNCIMCGHCDEVCPAGDINHIERWTELREKATARGLTAERKPILNFGNIASETASK